MQPKHSAIVAGLTLALSFGAVSAPTAAVAEEPTPGVASDATDIDKGLYTQQSFSGVLRSVQGVSFVNVTTEMKYFTKYESHGNYNQGFSYGDGYNALGYYQFDRRWSLIPFMKQAYNYNPEKYSMLKDAIDRGSEISNASNSMSENGQLTELGRIAQEAFQGAYNTDPAEFSALQDAYAYNSYYAVTEAWLKSGLGIDISGRADCVKGMVWSITNMCGTGGCRDFFRWANLSNDMTDREFVTALSDSVVNNVATKFSSQPQYHEGWKNRYKNELKDCLAYIAEDEAASTPSTPANPVQPESTPTPAEPEPTPAPAPSQTPATPADPTPGASTEVNGGANDNDKVDTPSTDAPSTNDGKDSSADDTDGSTSGSTNTGSSDSSTGSNDSSADNGSSPDAGSSSDVAPGSDASKDDSNKAPDAPVTSTDKRPSFAGQLGSTLGSSLMAGVNNGSTPNKGNSDQVSAEKTEVAKADSKGEASEKADSDKGSSSEEKGDKSDQKKDEGKKSESEEKDKSEDKTEDDKKQSDDGGKSGGDDQVQEQNDSKTVTTTTTTTTTTKSSGGNMPKTGDLIVMASLASASLATLGATSIVSGKHKLDQQKNASGEDGSEE